MKKLVLLCLFTLLCATCLVSQQSTASVNGTITDASGAVLPGAQVTVAQPTTGATRTTVTGAAGDYSITFLTPGTYNMKVQAKGFATVQQNDINLLVGRTLTINQSLKPGGANEVVEVSSAPPMIDTSVSNVVGSIAPTEVSNLPILVRNFASLETLIPGVRQAEGFDPTKTKVGNISVNGGDGRQVDTSVDGGDNKDLVVGGLVQNFTMEGIQEFNVQTNRYTAEAGHSVAAVVNVVTKSGTNQIHGSVFGLFQNSALNKNDYFTLQTCSQSGIPSGNCPKPLLHEYQYGGSIGGPILKDKLFFFGAFEQRREPGNFIVNPTSYSNLQIFAGQTAGFPGGPYAVPVTTLPNPYLDTMWTAKLDWTINSQNSIFFRYGGQKWTTSNDQAAANGIFSSDGSAGNNNINNFHDFAIQWTSTISPTKVNAYTAHFQDMANTIPSAPLNSFTYPVVGGGVVTNPNITFGDGTTVGTNVNVPQETLIRKYQFEDVFTWTHNKHNLKFGGNWIYFSKMGGYFYSGLGYFMTFWDDPACIQTNTCPGAQYPLGISTPGALREMSFSTGSGSTAQPPWSSLGFFFQDDWKVSPRLTLNLGVRWDANVDFLVPQLGSTQADSNKAVWDLRQVMQNPNFPADTMGGQTISSIVGNTGNLQRTTTDWKEFQPRIGFAWDITGTGKHLLRGGYGIARDQIFQNLTLFSIQQTQPIIYQTVFDVTTSNSPSGTGCTSPTTPVNLCTFQFGVTPLPVPPPPTQTDLAAGAVPRIVNPNATDPWSQQFGIGYAWQINNDYAFSADYVHILGTHEERVLNQNPLISSVCNSNYGGLLPTDPTYGTLCPNGISTRLLDPAFVATGVGAGRFAQIYEYSTNNRSFYDGVTFALRKRMSKRFMFQASDVISWSRAWGGFPVASYGGSGLAVTPAQQFQPDEFNYTNFDERNRFVFSGVFNLPAGFSVNPIFTAASARPYSFLAGTDTNGDGRTVLDRVCQGTNIGTFDINSTADVNAAQGITAAGQGGCPMIKPNTLRGIPFVDMDLRVDKVFNFGERTQLYLYWEFYNIFNRANFCNSYEQSVGAGASFNTPQSYCSGPSNGGAVSGFSAAAIPAFSNQFGVRFNF